MGRTEEFEIAAKRRKSHKNFCEAQSLFAANYLR